MRTIKFRGKSLKGDWFSGLLTHDKDKFRDKEWFISNRAGKPYAYAVRPETIGQFTGYCDKNGTEIYEGDIIKCCKGQKRKSAVDEWEDDNDFYVVEYTKGLFLGVSTWCLSLDSVEVIGNKYDNPELLTHL